MTKISKSLRQLVIQRADNRCEYCGISQIGQVATFHIDHIIPVVANGKTTDENLALACVSCSLRKGYRQEIEDSQTGEIVSIFNPPQQQWKSHFRWDGVQIIGLTATGRATIEALDLNRATMLAIRTEENLLGRHPPP
ncbi:MAG: HNH endonuclease signature motif containing protein [Nostocaceae cyanobacterium]|nr:HNH endonuclease signature motif containing protein [Nostocaceae cyanobacterium]